MDTVNWKGEDILYLEKSIDNTQVIPSRSEEDKELSDAKSLIQRIPHPIQNQRDYTLTKDQNKTLSKAQSIIKNRNGAPATPQKANDKGCFGRWS
jgi:nitrate reductase cytochrome c-type subunit